MIYHLESLPASKVYDVCVIGSGPAGATVVNELQEDGLSCCVLESGKRKKTVFADSLKQLEFEGLEIKGYSRERCLGGTSVTWAGLTSPLDPIDLEPRPWLEYSGWPITYCELESFYNQASKYRFFPIDKFQTQAWSHIAQLASSRPVWSNMKRKVFLASSEPQNFAKEFNSWLESDNIDLILDASVVGLRGRNGESEVTHAIVRDCQGAEQHIRANVFVLAANGIENARLLLLSQGQKKDGLGNQNGVVGRFFMNHPKNYFGSLQFTTSQKSLPDYFGFLENDVAGYVGLRLRPDLQRQQGVLNSYTRLQPMYDWTDNRGIESLLYFIKRSASVKDVFRRINQGRVVELRDYAETGDDSDLQNAGKTPFDLLKMMALIVSNAPDVGKYLFYRAVSKRKPNVSRARLRNFMEMEPDPQNRITLSEKRDHFGNAIPRLNCRLTKMDRRSIAEVHQNLLVDLARNKWATLQSPLTAEEEPWPIGDDASHHLGTTRMGSDPKTSVVDKNCRIWGIGNVYISGGSVFPTSGCANPTFTVVALAIRLAEHLRSEFCRPSRDA